MTHLFTAGGWKEKTVHLATEAPLYDILRKPYDYTFKITRKNTHYTEVSIAHELSTKCRGKTVRVIQVHRFFFNNPHFRVTIKRELKVGMLGFIFACSCLVRGASASRLAPFVWFTPACGEPFRSALNWNEMYSSFKNEWYRNGFYNRGAISTFSVMIFVRFA